jgi:hypothetical protein
MSVLKRIGWEPFGWLIYSLPYLFTSLFANISAGEKTMHVAFYVAFLVFYLGGHLIRGPQILWMVAGLGCFELLHLRLGVDRARL